MRLGRTIAGGRDSTENDLERQKLLKKQKKLKRLQLMIFMIVVLLCICTTIFLVQKAIKAIPESTTNRRSEEKKYTPSITMIDEDGSDYITDKMKQYAGRIEKDLKDIGLKPIKIIIPTGKARELDVYIEGREEYYKCNLDRGTAETAEDILRMIDYLTKNTIKSNYVDLRIEGRAYYK